MHEEAVDTSLARGSVADHGAHVLSWAPKGHDSIIWLSEHAVFAPGKAIRGGVPICFPWFGSGRSGDMQPAHGFARRAVWRLLSVDVQDEVATVVHELTQAEATSPEFPHRYQAVATAVFGDTLELSLSVTNTGRDSFSFEAALHTYLRVGDVTSISIVGLEGDGYLDQVTGARAVQDGPLGFVGEVDRIYASEADVRVHDPELGRVITLTKTGSASTVVWNPWVEKSARLPDFGDDEWRTMVCVETANVGAAAVLLEPGESHVMRVRISVTGE